MKVFNSLGSTLISCCRTRWSHLAENLNEVAFAVGLVVPAGERTLQLTVKDCHKTVSAERQT